MNINISLDDLAAEITNKIRDEVSMIKVVDFGEVRATVKLDNGGWTAQVMLPGAETLTNPLNCLQNYVPRIGDWVMIIYPPKSEPVLVDCTPMRENEITTPEDKFVSADGEIEIPVHDHDGRYYTKNQSDDKYSPLNHDHDGRYYTKTQSDERYSSIQHDHGDQYAAKDHDHSGGWIWQYAALLETWTMTHTGHNPPGYYKDIQGVVHLRGRVTGGSLGSPIMQLPEAPQFIETRAGISGDGTLAIIEIFPDGRVIPVTGDPAAWISLDGISVKI